MSWLSFPILCLLTHAAVHAKFQELSWKIDTERVSSFPGFKYYNSYNLTHNGPIDLAGTHVDFFAVGYYTTEEHLYTHMDAPYHFVPEGKTIDKIPLDDLAGPLIKVNISSRAAKVKDAEVTVDDLVDWENKHGTIPSRSFVLMHSGWDKYFGDNVKYFGSNDAEGPFHFPGFSEGAARWLLDNRNILGIGTDTVSCDSMAHLFDAHKLILPAGKVCIENLKDIDKVPDCGARFMMFPILLRNGTGAQGRALAEWFPGIGFRTSCQGKLQQSQSFFDSGSTCELVSFLCIQFCLYVSLFFTA